MAHIAPFPDTTLRKLNTNFNPLREYSYVCSISLREISGKTTEYARLQRLVCTKTIVCVEYVMAWSGRRTGHRQRSQ